MLKKHQRIFNHRPAVLMLYSFLLAAVIGALLLRLPIASTHRPLSWLDAFFMSTSAVCVTGLSVADIGKDLTLFGQLVILVLIQLGGLGIMTFSLLFLIFVGRKISLHSQLCVQDLSQDISTRNIKYSVYLIFVMTAVIESAGAVCLFLSLRQSHSLFFAVYSAIFHSVSAFCNAGFSLYPDSFVGFNSNPYVLGVLMSLIVLGGLGFIVIYDVLQIILNKKRRAGRIRLSLHSKIALLGSLIFVVAGAVIIWVLEHQAILRDMPLGEQVLNAVFLSVSSRTAGFNSVDTALLSNPTLFMLFSFMFIGGCPGSTAGGIKIQTFFTVAALVRNRIRGLGMVSLFKRKIPDAVVDRALAIFGASSLIIFMAVFFLQITETGAVSQICVQQRGPFLDTLFEAISAFGTVGLSTGITPQRSAWGKAIVILLMFIGRIGPLTLGIALQLGQRQRIEYSFPNEEISVS